MRIVADENIPFLKGRFEPFAEVRYLPAVQITPKTVKNADALIVRSVTRCNSNLLEGSSVRFIATATSGDDHIDKDFCDKKNISRISAKGANASAVEQYIQFSLLHMAVQNNYQLEGMTLGIVGVGNIGNRVKMTAEILGMKTLLNDPPRQRTEGPSGFVDLDELIRNSDIITLHVPLAFDGPDKTYRLAGSDFFSACKKGFSIINTSRGEVIRDDALLNEAKAGRLSSCIFDVWDKEPFISEDILALCDIGTPHIAGYSVQGKRRASEVVIRGVKDFFGFEMQKEVMNDNFSNNPVDIRISGKGFTNEKLLLQVMTKVTNLNSTSKTLKTNPKEFERMRSEYQYRNENFCFRPTGDNISPEAMQILEKFGFNNI